MSYIAFLDLVGTREAALISSQHYSKNIDLFAKSLKEIGNEYKCSIYGYSDNAYIEVENLYEMLKLFGELREKLRRSHIYFTAAVDKGTLNAKSHKINKATGNIMTFENPSTAEIYKLQTEFQGVGYTISKAVCDDLKKENLENSVKPSAFECISKETSSSELIPIMDLAYDRIGCVQLKYVIIDYLKTMVMNARAARYYITPIITMIKSYDTERLEHDLDELVKTITFQNIPKSFINSSLETHKMLFVFSLIDYLLSMEEGLESTNIELCQQIIRTSNIPVEHYVKIIAKTSDSIISRLNKHEFIKILYDYDSENI